MDIQVKKMTLAEKIEIFLKEKEDVEKQVFSENFVGLEWLLENGEKNGKS